MILIVGSAYEMKRCHRRPLLAPRRLQIFQLAPRRRHTEYAEHSRLNDAGPAGDMKTTGGDAGATPMLTLRRQASSAEQWRHRALFVAYQCTEVSAAVGHHGASDVAYR